ncbi:hypothetical protein [Motilimonas cestriensis]|uniref:hypothetical protein n=1 Tax=Motilimonas cestriensis TaxID=2742685 RepID=UPI003DA32E27
MLQSSRFALSTRHQGRTLVLSAQSLEMRWLAAMPWEHAWYDPNVGRLYLHISQVTALGVDLAKLTIGFKVHRRHTAALSRISNIEFACIKVQNGNPVSAPYNARNNVLLPVEVLNESTSIIDALKLIVHRSGGGKLASGDADINALI